MADQSTIGPLQGAEWIRPAPFAGGEQAIGVADLKVTDQVGTATAIAHAADAGHQRQAGQMERIVEKAGKLINQFLDRQGDRDGAGSQGIGHGWHRRLNALGGTPDGR